MYQQSFESTTFASLLWSKQINQKIFTEQNVSTWGAFVNKAFTSGWISNQTFSWSKNKTFLEHVSCACFNLLTLRKEEKLHWDLIKVLLGLFENDDRLKMKKTKKLERGVSGSGVHSSYDILKGKKYSIDSKYRPSQTSLAYHSRHHNGWSIFSSF